MIWWSNAAGASSPIAYMDKDRFTSANENARPVTYTVDAKGVITATVVFDAPEVGINALSFFNNGVSEFLIDNFILQQK